MKTISRMFSLLAVMFLFMAPGNAVAVDVEFERFLESLINNKNLQEMSKAGDKIGSNHCKKLTSTASHCLQCVQMSCALVTARMLAKYYSIRVGLETFFKVHKALTKECIDTGVQHCPKPQAAAEPVIEKVAEKVTDEAAKRTLRSLLEKLWESLPERPNLPNGPTAEEVKIGILGGLVVGGLIGLGIWIFAQNPQLAFGAILALSVLAIGSSVQAGDWNPMNWNNQPNAPQNPGTEANNDQPNPEANVLPTAPIQIPLVTPMEGEPGDSAAMTFFVDNYNASVSLANMGIQGANDAGLAQAVATAAQDPLSVSNLSNVANASFNTAVNTGSNVTTSIGNGLNNVANTVGGWFGVN